MSHSARSTRSDGRLSTKRTVRSVTSSSDATSASAARSAAASLPLRSSGSSVACTSSTPNARWSCQRTPPRTRTASLIRSSETSQLSASARPVGAVAAVEQRLVHEARRHLQRRRFGVAQRHQVRRLAVEVKAQRSAAARRRRNRGGRRQRARGRRRRTQRRQVGRWLAVRDGRAAVSCRGGNRSTSEQRRQRDEDTISTCLTLALAGRKPPCYSGLAASRGGRGSP